MAVAFQRTLRALAVDRPIGPVARVLAASALFGAWLAWFAFARVAVSETSLTARLEVTRRGSTIETPVPGRIVTSQLRIGRHVTEGEVLVQLDARVAEERLAAERAHLAAIEPRLAAKASEMSAESSLEGRQGERSRRAVEEAQARRDQADERLRLAREESARSEKLFAGQATSEAELKRARSTVEQRRSEAEAQGLEIQRLESQARTDRGEIATRMARLRSAVAELEGELHTGRATVEALQREVENHALRAPVSGEIGEVAERQAGAYVQAGERLATIVPSGEVRAVAEFTPAASIGRLHPGQHGRIRVDGFPWTQYGTLAATVSQVGGEVRDGRVRVELALDRAAERGPIPIQHGLPGQVEVEVERVAPWVLTLRAAGRLLGRGGSAHE